MPESPKSLTDVVDQLEDKASEDGDLSAQDALDEFAGRLFGPLLVIPGLVTVTPVGAIPLVPTVMGVWTLLVAGQALLGRTHPWLPGMIANRSVNEEKFRDSIDQFRPWIKYFDRIAKPRLTYMVRGPMKYVIAAICIVLACTFPPLELVPFGCAMPGIALLLLGLAVTSRDGLMAIAGLVAAVVAVGVLWWLAPL